MDPWRRARKTTMIYLCFYSLDFISNNITWYNHLIWSIYMFISVQVSGSQAEYAETHFKCNLTKDIIGRYMLHLKLHNA